MNLNFVIAQFGGGAQGSQGLMSLLPLLLIVVIFYFFMIRPQMKRQKELREFREALKKGDKVVTSGGIYGKIVSIQDNTIDMEIADGVKIKIDKSAVLKDSSDLAQQK